MTRHDRASFASTREVLDHAIGYLARVCDRIDQLRGGDVTERVGLLLDVFGNEQKRLLAALERYADDAPSAVLDTYFQFVIEVPETLSEPPEPLTTLGITQWLLGLDRYLVRVFEELADTAIASEVRDACVALVAEVEAHDRRLSKEFDRSEDL